MAMSGRLWKAKIRLRSGLQEVTVVAGDYFRARDLIEAQYGKGCIFSGPVPA
jgi:hypothetical protein